MNPISACWDSCNSPEAEKNENRTITMNLASLSSSPHRLVMQAQENYQCHLPEQTLFHMAEDEYDHQESKDYYYYLQCMMAGAFSSSIRWIKTPLDVVKCNMQAFPKQFPTNTFRGLQHIWIHEGLWTGLYKGLGPTVVAYSIQSGIKYSLYEMGKDHVTSIAGAMLGDDYVHHHRGLVYLLSAGLAEAVADIFMCPFEMIKVKVQTSPYSPVVSGGGGVAAAAAATTTSTGTFPTAFRPALMTMMTRRAEFQFPFGALGPLWARQIPGTMLNMYIFEHTVASIYQHILNDKPKQEYSIGMQLGATFCSGYTAGLISAAVSHPADALVSYKTTRPEMKHKTLRQIVQEVGLRSLVLNGLGPRVFIVGTSISFQWLLYDSCKTAMGLGTMGSNS